MKITDLEKTIDNFSKYQKEQGKSDNTIKTYVGVLKKFQLWLTTKDITLEQISKNEVQSYIDYLEQQQKNAGTIEKYLAAISIFTRFLGKSEIILDIRHKEKIKDSEIPNSLEKDEEKQLLFEVKSEGNLRNIAIVYTLLYTGIRVSELCALNLNDIKMIDKKGKLLVKNKQGEIERLIPLSTEVSKHLKNYINSLNAANKKQPLFISSVNKRISTRAVQYILQKYNVNPHKLRHTFCQKLINNGIDINAVAKLAGHKDINVTKRYASVFEPNLEDAIEQTFS